MIFGLGWHQTKADEELLKIHGVVICKPHTSFYRPGFCYFMFIFEK